MNCITLLFTIEGITNHFDVMIKNEQQSEDGFRYGSLFVDATEKELFYIRRYILKEQLGKLSSVLLNIGVNDQGKKADS